MHGPPTYPRIPHLFDVRAGDERLPDSRRSLFLTEPVVIEEKLDGANVSVWLDDGIVQVATRSGIGGRDRAGQLGRLRPWVAERSDALAHLLSDDWVLYGEWLYLTHGIRYDRLPDLLVGLDLWHPSEGFVDTTIRDHRLGAVGLPTPPQLFRGVVGDRARLEGLLGCSAFSNAPAEGVVLRREADGRTIERAKFVRPGFSQRSDDDWATGRRYNAVQRRYRSA